MGDLEQDQVRQKHVCGRLERRGGECVRCQCVLDDRYGVRAGGYGIPGFIEGARIASCSANTGLNYESDAIAACVIGGVSFVGGTGKISGIVIGVFLLQIIFVGLNFLSVDANMLYVIKGLIILVACAIDMRKYLARK